MSYIKTIRHSLFEVDRRYDLTRWQHKPSLTEPVYVLYHIFCADGWWQLASEQMRHLRSSGLYDAADEIWLSIITRDEKNVDELKNIVGPKAKVINMSKRPEDFEFPALDYLLKRSKESDFLVFYFHGKGVSNWAGKDDNARLRHYHENSEAWRRAMEYFNIDLWNVAVNVLHDGYDTYGCLHLLPPEAMAEHYAGNFWWARSQYVRSLQPVSASERANRFKAEFWILSAHPHAMSGYDCRARLYFQHLPESFYRGSRRQSLKHLLFGIKYNKAKIIRRIIGYDPRVKRYNKETRKR